MLALMYVYYVLVFLGQIKNIPPPPPPHPYMSLSQQMQLVCSAETKADELFLSGKLSESDALQARVLMGDLDIDVVRILCANYNYAVVDSLQLNLYINLYWFLWLILYQHELALSVCLWFLPAPKR